MHFALAPQHLEYYYRNHMIEFEELLSEEEAHALCNEVIENNLSGRDVWRKNKLFQKVSLRKQLAEIAANLTKKYPLRIGYDQLLFVADALKEVTLSEMSSIQGLVGGCILHLTDGKNHKIGSGTFFGKNTPILFEELCENTHLLIVYAEESSIYTFQESDPYTHALKKLDYVFGDRLKNTTHPILYRR